MMGYLSENDHIPPEPIFRQLLGTDKAERNFLTICKRAHDFQNKRFQYRLLETLTQILVTESSLAGLRVKL